MKDEIGLVNGSCFTTQECPAKAGDKSKPSRKFRAKQRIRKSYSRVTLNPWSGQYEANGAFRRWTLFLLLCFGLIVAIFAGLEFWKND